VRGRQKERAGVSAGTVGQLQQVHLGTHTPQWWQFPEQRLMDDLIQQQRPRAAGLYNTPAPNGMTHTQ
jgi:hypothetical protein